LILGQFLIFLADIPKRNVESVYEMLFGYLPGKGENLKEKLKDI
jgi:hypothetical protein